MTSLQHARPTASVSGGSPPVISQKKKQQNTKRNKLAAAYEKSPFPTRLKYLLPLKQQHGCERIGTSSGGRRRRRMHAPLRKWRRRRRGGGAHRRGTRPRRSALAYISVSRVDPDNSSPSPFSARTRPRRLNRTVSDPTIEQMSRRWRGGHDSAVVETRRDNLISTSSPVGD